MQAAAARNAARCFFGTAPCLSAVSAAYGDSVAAAWVELQLRDLAEYAGPREKLSGTQSQQTAAAILTGYGHLNLAELLLFFARFKAGRYGRFYGAVDPLAITDALRTFCKQRVAEITAIELAVRARERDRDSGGGVSREEYLRIKRRAEAGDGEAIRLLTPPQERVADNNTQQNTSRQ